MSTVHKPAVDDSSSGEMMMMTMTKHTLHAALLAFFVGGSAGVPLQAQAQEEGKTAAQNEVASDRFSEPVTVRVTNHNWLNMRIYVVETATHRSPWRLGEVTGLSTASFELPDHLGAELGNLILVAAPIGSRQRQFTDRLLTWPGAHVDWTIAPVLSLSFASVY